MEPLSYQQFIDGINNCKIVKAVFLIEEYAHYKNCVIERATDIIDNGKSTVHINYISVKLSNDSEHFSFLKEFDEDLKLFDMKRKGKFTLKQMWDRIKFITIEYGVKD
ncbi:MAG: hypothetical protein J1F71_02665 [Clostridiales bacterium]|nr:hypothetical protein [Clostridiales bacterium]